MSSGSRSGHAVHPPHGSSSRLRTTEDAPLIYCITHWSFLTSSLAVSFIPVPALPEKGRALLKMYHIRGLLSGMSKGPRPHSCSHGILLLLPHRKPLPRGPFPLSFRAQSPDRLEKERAGQLPVPISRDVPSCTRTRSLDYPLHGLSSRSDHGLFVNAN